MELDRWNTGSLGPQRSWHPQPRVVVSEPVVAAGKADATGAMRALRAGQYVGIRRCYDRALRETPDLEGRTVLRLSVRRDGRVASARVVDSGRGVPDTRKFGKAMPDATVRSYLAQSFGTAHVPELRSKTATMLVAVDVWPGDAPLPEKPPGPLPGRVSLAEVEAQLAAKRATLMACFDQGRSRAPHLWGRLVVRFDVDGSGQASRVEETESTFPDRDVVRCVTEQVRQSSWPGATGGEARVLVAWRLDNETGKIEK